MTDEELGRIDPTVTLDEWILVVRRLFDLINQSLDAFEQRLAETGRKDKKPLNDADARRLQTIARTVERVHVISNSIAEDSDKAKTIIEETRDAREAFKRRIAKFVAGGKA
jgi:hypothetical protein